MLAGLGSVKDGLPRSLAGDRMVKISAAAGSNLLPTRAQDLSGAHTPVDRRCKAGTIHTFPAIPITTLTRSTSHQEEEGTKVSSHLQTVMARLEPWRGPHPTTSLLRPHPGALLGMATPGMDQLQMARI